MTIDSSQYGGGRLGYLIHPKGHMPIITTLDFTPEVVALLDRVWLKAFARTSTFAGAVPINAQASIDGMLGDPVTSRTTVYPAGSLVNLGALHEVDLFIPVAGAVAGAEIDVNWNTGETASIVQDYVQLMGFRFKSE